MTLQNIKFDVFSRWTGDVQFTAEIQCHETDSTYVRLGLAVKWGYKFGASLVGARLDGASLVGARLDGASLDGASLVGARLDGASLVGARLGKQWIIHGATRSDGYAFFLQRLTNDKEPMVKAGCRYFTLAKAQKHWTETRGETPLGQETEIIVRAMVAVMQLRGPDVEK